MAQYPALTNGWTASSLIPSWVLSSAFPSTATFSAPAPTQLNTDNARNSILAQILGPNYAAALNPTDPLRNLTTAGGGLYGTTIPNYLSSNSNANPIQSSNPWTQLGNTFWRTNNPAPLNSTLTPSRVNGPTEYAPAPTNTPRPSYPFGWTGGLNINAPASVPVIPG